MAKNLIISILASILICVVADRVDASRSRKAEPLIDGFVLAGVDGKLATKDDKWFFEFDSDVSDGRGRVRAGTSLELLPSAALEKMIADVKKHSAATYRLWGRVTEYRGKNFIFPIYFLPIGEIERPQSPAPEESQQQEAELTINEPNDVLTIPEEIVAKLKARKIVRVEQLRKGLELKQDSILADRTGFIVRQADGELVFVLDALGWNIQQQISLCLLPCEALRRAQREQFVEPNQLRFKVSGIVTKYKNQYYLLLQQAIRIYSYENFGR